MRSPEVSLECGEGNFIRGKRQNYGQPTRLYEKNFVREEFSCQENGTVL